MKLYGAAGMTITGPITVCMEMQIDANDGSVWFPYNAKLTLPEYIRLSALKYIKKDGRAILRKVSSDGYGHWWYDGDETRRMIEVLAGTMVTR